MKFKLNGMALAISGKGNRVMVVNMAANRVQLEIHDIDRDAGKLVCQFDVANDGSVCALNEDGTDAALVNSNGNLRIVAVNKVVGDKADQSAIVSVNVSESLGKVRSLV